MPNSFRALVEALDDAVVVFRAQDRRAEFANRAYDGLVGGPGLGRVPIFFDDPTARHELIEAVEQGTRVRFRLDAFGPAGRPVDITLLPLDDPGAYAAILRDLTPMVELEDRLVSRACRDPLTGLYNKGAFSEQAQARFSASTRYDRPLSLAILDLDHFKRVNDTWGHPIGDRVLAAVAHAAAGVVRTADILGRVGGEEFALLAPETSLAGASTLGVRLCNAVRRATVDGPEGPIGVTLSVGVAERSAADPDLTALLARADAALYRAKAEGRDRVALDRG